MQPERFAKKFDLKKAEDRELFKECMNKIGLESAKAKIAKNINKKKLITVNMKQLKNLIEIKKIIKNKSLGKVINADFKWNKT